MVEVALANGEDEELEFELLLFRGELGEQLATGLLVSQM